MYISKIILFKSTLSRAVEFLQEWFPHLVLMKYYFKIRKTNTFSVQTCFFFTKIKSWGRAIKTDIIKRENNYSSWKLYNNSWCLLKKVVWIICWSVPLHPGPQLKNTLYKIGSVYHLLKGYVLSFVQITFKQLFKSPWNYFHQIKTIFM